MRMALMGLLAAGMLAACGGGPSSKTATPAPTQAQTVSTRPVGSATAASGATVASGPPGATAPAAAATTSDTSTPTTAVATSTEPPLPPAATDTPVPPPPSPSPGTSGGITIVAKDISFDKTSITASGAVTINFSNQDTGVTHNIHFFKGTSASGASVGNTAISAGPVQVMLSLGALASGTYYYQCDVHPSQMKGTLTVS